jgi:hypothetical protein
MPKLTDQKITPHPDTNPIAASDEVGEIMLSRWQLSLIQRAMNLALIQTPVNRATLLTMFTQEERDELQSMIDFCDEFDTTRGANGNRMLNGWVL